MKKKLALSLSCLVVLGLYGCSEDNSGTKQSERTECTFESPYCEGNILYVCKDGVENTEICTEKCSDEEGRCVDDGESLHDCGESGYFDQDKGECVDDPEIPSCDSGKHYDESAGECVDDPEIPSCDPGKHYDESAGECVDDPEPSCDPGKHYDESAGECVADGNCLLGSHLDEKLGKCIEVCKCGYVYDETQGKCVEKDLFPELSDYEKHQLALRETAMAFYRKGDNIQYESWRRSQYISPETASSQHMEFLVCSGYVYAVFYQALGIELPNGTNKYNAYGKGFAKANDDIIFFADGDNLAGKIENNETKQKFLEELLKLLKLGDAISYYGYIKDKDGKVTTDAGHVIFAYDFVKDDKGNITDVVILHSTSNYEPLARRTTKLGSGTTSRSLSWRAKKNDETGVSEGTVQKTLLSNLIKGFSTKNKSEFVVLRPIIKDKTYKHVEFSGYKAADYPNWKESATIMDEAYDIKDATLCRMQYHDIEIEKTLDVHPGSTVEPGEMLTYQIEITNHSDKAYQDIYITEDLSENVVLKEANGGIEYTNAVAWFVPSIDAGTTHKITYTVEVKNDPDLVGKKVISTGAVAQIQSKTIENVIAYNLSAEEIKTLKLAYKLIAEGGKIKGIEAIEKSYKEALDYDLRLKDLELGALYLREKSNPNTTFKNYPEQIPYYKKDIQHYDEAKNGALLVSLYGNSSTDFFLNQKHDLASMILNHYYSGVYSAYATDTNKKVYSSSAYPKLYENSINAPDSRTDRENMIYPETLRDGDILIYANTMDTITKEDGLYAYLFLDGKFQGVNSSPNAPKEILVKDGVVPEFYKTHDKGEQKSMIERFGDLPKLFGKDFYVILRPALMMKKPATDSKP